MMINKNNWPEETEEKIKIENNDVKIPWFKILVVFIFLAGAGALILGYFLYEPEEPKINIEIQKPEKILAGESFDLKAIVYNNSDQKINQAKILLILPPGISFLEDDPNKRNIQLDVGSIEPNSFYSQTFKLIAFSKELSVKRLELKLNYKTIDSPVFFENKSYIDLNIEGSAINIFVSAPSKVYSSQRFKMNIVYKNNSEYDFNNVLLVIDYPPTFKFIESKPTNQNNEWRIGLLKSKSKGEIEISGEVIGDQNYNNNFVIKILTTLADKSFVLAYQNYNLEVLKPLLALNVLVNDQSNYVASIDEELNYTFQYINNSDTPMENVVLTTKLESNLFDFSSVQTNAYFDSINNIFIWDPTNYPQFRLLPPHSFGELQLKIKLKNNFPILSPKDKNFVLKVEAKIESPTVLKEIFAERTFSSYIIETKVNGKVVLESFALYRDAEWGILNKGPYPPRSETPTQYSVHWRIKNYATDLTNVRISSNILPGTKYTGLYKSNFDLKLNYNSDSGKIWVEIPKILANQGVLDKPLEIVFQIENTPSSNQVGEIISLLSLTHFQAKDDFTGHSVIFSLPEIKSDILEDKTIKASDRRVLPK